MKKSFQYVLAVAAAAVAAFSLFACGDEVTEVTEIRQEGMAVLEKGEKLSKQACDTTNVGEMLFVMDSSEAFICDGESWQTLKGEKGEDGEKGEKGDKGSKGDSGKDGSDGTSCTAKYVIDKAKMLTGVALSCGESIVDTIWNGADGKDGDDGTNCSAKLVKNKAKTRDGIEVTCGETVVDTIWNGEKGDNGEAGKSAYEIAKENGFEGTEAEWLESMKGPFIQDKRDGKIYKTVKIGNQVWMAENLNYDPNYLPKGAKDSVILSRCYLNYAKYCEKYGRLYTWAAAMDSVAAFSNDGKGCGYTVECEPSETVRGICPEGWHLPSYQEFETLLNVADPDFGTGFGQRESETAGKFLKSALGWDDYNGANGNGSNSYGFSTLPAGGRIFDGYFNGAGYNAYFWSASEYRRDYAYTMYLNFRDENADLRIDDKYYGFSVRCLQNN